MTGSALEVPLVDVVYVESLSAATDTAACSTLVRVRATNVWTVNSAAYTEAFRRFTSLRLGVEPQDTEFRITSGHVRASAGTFTLTSAMCDCGALVGLRNGSLADNEVGVEAWLGWLRDLPAHVPRVTRLAVLHAWSPQEEMLKPRRSRAVTIEQVDEPLLREIRDDILLTIDYSSAAG